MYTLSKIDSKRLNKKTSLAPFFALFLALALLASAVRITLNFRQLYYWDLSLLKIPQQSGFGRSEIVKNYDALIDYMKPSYTGELKFPTFPMSSEAKEHFVEVKDLFNNFNYLMYVSAIIGVIALIVYLVKKNYRFLKWTAIYLIVLPVALAIPFAVNFDASFTAFHKLFFNNNYWQFDPQTDPIINVLPQAFFMHTAIMILLIMTVESIILYIIYRKNVHKEIKGYH